MNSRIAIALFAAAALGAAASPALAQPYPSKPITYIVPFTPGGTTDVIGRTIAQGLAPALGQPVVVDNKPGAAGAVGATTVAKAKPDGYTLLGGTISTHAINASLYKDLPYDPIKDFEPITLVGFIPNALYVDANLPIKNVQELITFLKNNPTRSARSRRPARARRRTSRASSSPISSASSSITSRTRARRRRSRTSPAARSRSCSTS